MNRDRYDRAKKVSEERQAAATQRAGAMAIDSAARSRQTAAAEAVRDQERAAALEAAKERTLAQLDANGFPGIQRISFGKASTILRREPILEPGWHLFTEHGEPELDRYDGRPPYRDDYYLMADGTIRHRHGQHPDTEPRIVSSAELAGAPERYGRTLAALQRLTPDQPVSS